MRLLLSLLLLVSSLPVLAAPQLDKLTLPKGFHIALYADHVPDAREITLGANGSFVSLGENQRGDSAACYRIAAESVMVIDTTGAGDAFSGALVAALVLFCERPFRDAIRHANRVAALSTETIGAAPAMPNYATVIARFVDQDIFTIAR